MTAIVGNSSTFMKTIELNVTALASFMLIAGSGFKLLDYQGKVLPLGRSPCWGLRGLALHICCMTPAGAGFILGRSCSRCEAHECRYPFAQP